MNIPYAPDLEIHNPITLYAPQSAQWVAPTWLGEAQVGATCAELAVPANVVGKIEINK